MHKMSTNELKTQAVEKSTEYPEISSKGKRYRYIEPGVREYESGAIYQEGKGLISGPDSTKITSETAPQLTEAKREQRKQAVIEGMRRAAMANRKLTQQDLGADADVVAVYGEALAERVLDKSNRSGVAAFGVLAEMAGWRDDAKVKISQGSESAEGTPEQLAELLARLRKARGEG